MKTQLHLNADAISAIQTSTKSILILFLVISLNTRVRLDTTYFFEN